MYYTALIHLDKVPRHLFSFFTPSSFQVHAHKTSRIHGLQPPLILPSITLFPIQNY